MPASVTISACRSCESGDLRPFLDLGCQPLANAHVDPERVDDPEARFPLVVAHCPRCSLVQLMDTVAPEIVFQQDYPYFSSCIPALLEHSRLHALELIDRRGLGRDSFVVEIASNDGYMLRNFVGRGVPVLGIDPAAGPGAVARQQGVDTWGAFFNAELAGRVRDERGPADVIVANNVLAHVPDVNDFVDGVAHLLADDGVAVMEVHDVGSLVERCEFDTILHEHVCYYSVVALDQLFRRHGLCLNDVTELPIHGGSLRLHVGHRFEPGPAVSQRLEREAGWLGDHQRYVAFAQRVQDVGDRIKGLLGRLRSEGHRLAAYGAAAKGSTLLNHLGIGTETLSFVADRNRRKHGKLMPGVHVPIRPAEALLEEMPDDVLLLSWNFQHEILGQQAAFRQRGGRFIVPIPTPEIV